MSLGSGLKNPGPKVRLALAKAQNQPSLKKFFYIFWKHGRFQTLRKFFNIFWKHGRFQTLRKKFQHFLETRKVPDT